MNMNLGVPINREVEDAVEILYNYIHGLEIMDTRLTEQHPLMLLVCYYYAITHTMGENSIQETADSFGPKEQWKHFTSEKRTYDQ